MCDIVCHRSHTFDCLSDPFVPIFAAVALSCSELAKWGLYGLLCKNATRLDM